jgi:hypothetical protein
MDLKALSDLEPTSIECLRKGFIIEILKNIVFRLPKNEVEVNGKSIPLAPDKRPKIFSRPSLEPIARDGRTDLSRKRPAAAKRTAFVVREVQEQPRSRLGAMAYF